MAATHRSGLCALLRLDAGCPRHRPALWTVVHLAPHLFEGVSPEPLACRVVSPIAARSLKYDRLAPFASAVARGARFCAIQRRLCPPWYLVYRSERGREFA